MLARTTIHRCAQPKCPARGRNFSVAAREADQAARGQPVRCPACGAPSQFVRNETARLHWLRASAGVTIGILSMEVATRSGMERWPAIAIGIITFAISMFLLGVFDGLRYH